MAINSSINAQSACIEYYAKLDLWGVSLDAETHDRRALANPSLNIVEYSFGKDIWHGCSKEITHASSGHMQELAEF